MITRVGLVPDELCYDGEDRDGEDGFGGIAPRPVHRSERVYFHAPTQPRHPHWTPYEASSSKKPRHRSPESVERARQARIARRRNAS